MKLPDLSYENILWKKGIGFVGGADEVGRGCFAGPVVAASVVFPRNVKELLTSDTFDTFNTRDTLMINDSKKLTRLQRERADVWIRKNCITYGIGVGSVSHINKYGIISATNFAFRSAIRNAQNAFNLRINYLLIDAFFVPNIRGFRIPLKNKRKHTTLNTKGVNQLAIVKGDSVSLSIAAASIIAKVHRDKYMQKLSNKKKYSIYGWEKNKGYGTAKHRNAIREYGVSKLHRTSFVDTYLNKL